jgi:signal transduction histidine kinase
MSDLPEAPDSMPLPDPLLAAWLAQTHDLLVLLDGHGQAIWSNPAFDRATGEHRIDACAALARSVVVGSTERGSAGIETSAELCLRGDGGNDLWVRARVANGPGGERLHTLNDITAQKAFEARARHGADLLETAQEFGRLGVWERDVRSGKGRWDRHVFAFWGLPASDETPDYDAAQKYLHPDDIKAMTPLDTLRPAGRYSQRYRVLRPDGSVRWIHSQWEIKTGADGAPEHAIGIMMDDTEAHERARSLDSAAAQLKLAVDMGNVIVWHHDLATNRLQYNTRGYEVLGLPSRADGLSLEEIRALTHPDDLPRIVANAAEAAAGNLPVDVESRYRSSAGQWRTLLTRRVAQRSAAGELTGFIGVSLDVTDKAHHSRRAEQLTHRLNAAAAAGRMGLWTTTPGTDEVEWNAQMFELFDMVGEPAPLWRHWLHRCVAPDDVERVKRATLAYLSAGRGDFEIEFRIRRRDGSPRWIVLRSSVERADTDADGNHRRLFGIAMDVTERHAATAALHAASARAALIARSAGIGTWETTDMGAPAVWDDQMFHLRDLAPRGMALNREERLALVHPDDLHLVVDAFAGLHGNNGPSAYEFRVRLPDGSYRWLASRSTLLRDERGQPVKRVGVNWDVTEAKSAELARQQAALAARDNIAKTHLLSRVSHELRTPLNAVLGFTQLLQLEARTSAAPGSLDKLGHIRAAGEHLLALIDDLLDLSSLESGTLKLDLKPVPVAAAVREALPLVQQLAAEYCVRLRTGPLAGTAHADPTRLRQVLLNLLTNAIKYNRRDGEVVVDTVLGAEPGRVLLRVRDNGRGMRSDQLAQLFEPFNRLGVDGEGIDGSGIGLTIVKALVEGMKGRITVTSEPGRGTLFEVDLPARAAQATTSVAPTAASAPAPANGLVRSAQLLYIEDNEVNVLLVEELVRGVQGMRIASEPTGAAGVARAATLQPDLILIDMQLPDFDGFEVLRRLRASSATAHTPCIALSANAMPEDIARARQAGFDDYWTKPVKFKEFIHALEQRFPLG